MTFSAERSDVEGTRSQVGQFWIPSLPPVPIGSWGKAALPVCLSERMCSLHMKYQLTPPPQLFWFANCFSRWVLSLGLYLITALTMMADSRFKQRKTKHFFSRFFWDQVLIRCSTPTHIDTCLKTCVRYFWEILHLPSLLISFTGISSSRDLLSQSGNLSCETFTDKMEDKPARLIVRLLFGFDSDSAVCQTQWKYQQILRRQCCLGKYQFRWITSLKKIW